MFPLKDENPTDLTPFVTIAIIAINVAAHVGGFVAGAALIKLFASRPAGGRPTRRRAQAS